jgi:diadenosine tetraphosphate (Ap4A) HIT family hydrolase
MFSLHAQLEKDTYTLGEFPLCRLLLCKDANYPWCILVPKRSDIREIYQLASEDRQQLLDESCVLSQIMAQVFKPIKMNVAALGNQVSQLHLHHIARYEDDPAWPLPIWGQVPAKSYEEGGLKVLKESLREELRGCGIEFIDFKLESLNE